MFNKDTSLESILEKIIFHCGPTLKGVKVSSLVNFKSHHMAWQRHKKTIKSLINVSFIELKRTENNTLVLFYSFELLQALLYKGENQAFLKRFAYESFDYKKALLHLKRRFEKACPHEIGLFLGYPIEDVACFNACDEKPCLAIGYWKVYSNLELAIQTFKTYDKIRAGFVDLLKSGIQASCILKSL